MSPARLLALALAAGLLPAFACRAPDPPAGVRTDRHPGTRGPSDTPDEGPVPGRANPPAPSRGVATAVALPSPDSIAPPRGRGADGVERGDPAPDFVLPEVLSPARRVQLSQVIGPGVQAGPDGVVVGFVASWCGRCTDSLATLAALEKEHGPRLRLLLLATDEGADARRAEAQKVRDAGIRSAVLDASAKPEILDEWMGAKRNIPRFYLVNRTGQVKLKDTGFGQKMARLLPQQVDWLLNRSTAPQQPSTAAVDPALGG